MRRFSGNAPLWVESSRQLTSDNNRAAGNKRYFDRSRGWRARNENRVSASLTRLESKASRERMRVRPRRPIEVRRQPGALQ